MAMEMAVFLRHPTSDYTIGGNAEAKPCAGIQAGKSG
jgi:hypothetical protein